MREGRILLLCLFEFFFSFSQHICNANAKPFFLLSLLVFFITLNFMAVPEKQTHIHTHEDLDTYGKYRNTRKKA